MNKNVLQRNKVLFYILMTLAIFLTGCKGSQETATDKVAKETLEQLKKDYNEEFEIESADYVKETDSYTLFVHPKTEPDMSFRVIKWKKAGNELIDDYVKTRRGMQSDKFFKHFGDNISEKNLFSATLVDILDKKEYWDMNYSIEDLIKMHKKDSKIAIRIFLFFDLHEWNREEMCKKVYEMIKYIQDTEIAKADISIQFYDEEFFKDKDVVKILKEEMGPAGMMNFDSHYGDKYDLARIDIGTELGIKDFKTIKSYKDIENKIRYKKYTGQKDNIGGEIYEWVQK